MQGHANSVIFIIYSLIVMQQGHVIFKNTFLTHFVCWLNSIYLKPTLLQHPASRSLNLAFYPFTWLEPILPFVFHTCTHAHMHAFHQHSWRSVHRNRTSPRLSGTLTEFPCLQQPQWGSFMLKPIKVAKWVHTEPDTILTILTKPNPHQPLEMSPIYRNCHFFLLPLSWHVGYWADPPLSCHLSHNYISLLIFQGKILFNMLSVFHEFFSPGQ